MFTVLIILLSIFPALVAAQQGAGPEIPIVLEHADSIVGSGVFESSVRTFYGNVRFQQGNVTGRCDRAIHNVLANTVELFGNVVIKQGPLSMYAPEVRYSGGRFIANAPRGIRVEQKGQVITARKGVYATTTHIAEFFGDVVMRDDTTTVWSDSLVYDRDLDTMRAAGSVAGYDSTGNMWFEADIARRNAVNASYTLSRNARLWTWEPSEDTMYVSADSILSLRDNAHAGARTMRAIGDATLIKGATAAAAGEIMYDEAEERILLSNAPYVWTDSIAFAANAVTARIPGRTLTQMTGTGSAILMSQVQGVQPRRYDQIYGDSISLTFAQDSLRSLHAAGAAQSVTYRGEGGKQDGVAKVASDSIRALFDAGTLSEVYWLGGIAGEHHPERLVEGREGQFLLPSFQWREDRPLMPRPRKQNQR